MAENLKIASVNNPAADAENALAPVVQMPAAQKPKNKFCVLALWKNDSFGVGQRTLRFMLKLRETPASA